VNRRLSIDPKDTTFKLQIEAMSSNEEEIEERQNRIDVERGNKKNLFVDCSIGIHNINGLKGNHYKAQELVELGVEMKYNIIGLVETNIKETEGKFLKIDRKGYYTFWSSAEKDKHKGFGVEI
jgi:hypothetical protein